MATTIVSSQMGIGRIVWNEASRGWQRATFYESSRADDEPQPSPNGEWVAFCSTRSGNREIWRARPDGSEAMQLTVSGASRMGSPRWSADSQWIAFDSARESTSDIFLISAEGGKTRQMTSRFTSVRPSFSMDGKWLYCKNGGRWVKIPISGGEPQLVIPANVAEAFESDDGRWLYYFVDRQDEILRIPVSGPAAQETGQQKFHVAGAVAWALAGRHIYFGIGRGSLPARIVRVEIESGRQEEIYRFPPDVNPFSVRQTTLAVSRDEHTVYYQYRKRDETDIVMVEPFR